MAALSTRLAAVVALVAVLALGSAATAHAACTCPLRTDNACIDLGQTGIGSPYWWSHACWSTTNRNWGGADCSGFVVKTWQVPRSSPITEDYHPYGTYHLFNYRYHWYPVARSTAWKGDAVGYPDPDGASGPQKGHVVLYYTGSAYGNAYVLESTPPRIVKHWRSLSGSKWGVRRRHNLVTTAGPA